MGRYTYSKGEQVNGNYQLEVVKLSQRLESYAIGAYILLIVNKHKS